MSRHRVLVFSERFPPRGGAGVQRVLKHVKYLPEHGFEPVVVAGTPTPRLERMDPTLLRDLRPGTSVIRARTLPLQEAAWYLQGLLRRVGVDAPGLGRPLWPDASLGWVGPAAIQGLRAVANRSPHVLYSTSGPMSAHLAAFIVHRLTRLPWVADFRDAWALHPVFPIRADSFAIPSLLETSRKLESRVVAEASYVALACDCISLVGLQDNDPRRLVISNGVDPDDVGHSPAHADDGRFRLAHVGSLYAWRDGAPVFGALRDLVVRGEVDRKRLEVRIVGQARRAAAELDDLPVKRVGYVDHRRALDQMADATALLFFQPDRELSASGKIFEYLASGRPVLAVAHPDNRGYRLVEELGGGLCADVRDPGAIRSMLRGAFTAWQEGSLGVDPRVRGEVLRRFSRQTLTGGLADTLRDALTPRAAVPARIASAGRL